MQEHLNLESEHVGKHENLSLRKANLACKASCADE